MNEKDWICKDCKSVRASDTDDTLAYCYSKKIPYGVAGFNKRILRMKKSCKQFEKNDSSKKTSDR